MTSKEDLSGGAVGDRLQLGHIRSDLKKLIG